MFFLNIRNAEECEESRCAETSQKWGCGLEKVLTFDFLGIF